MRQRPPSSGARRTLQPMLPSPASQDGAPARQDSAPGGTEARKDGPPCQDGAPRHDGVASPGGLFMRTTAPSRASAVALLARRMLRWFLR